VRTASRLFRMLVALAVLAVSVGWLLRRRAAAVWTPAVPPEVEPPEVDVVVAEVVVEPERPADASADEEPVAVVPPDAVPADEVLVDEEPVAVVLAEEVAAAEVVEAVPAVDDDLRRIRGIGPSIERTLHGLGISTYRQLATLDEAGLQRVRETLRDFPQRIEREDWCGQAAALHEQKYGQTP
jgi:predicted flap endonuclease-1-like 5' DNA nuclease